MSDGSSVGPVIVIAALTVVGIFLVPAIIGGALPFRVPVSSAIENLQIASAFLLLFAGAYALQSSSGPGVERNSGE